MSAIKVRKNFIFDKEMIEKTGHILKQHNKSFTEAISLYFQAIIKEPSILEMIDKSAHKRTGNFIGMLDGKVGSEDYKDMKKEYYENISWCQYLFNLLDTQRPTSKKSVEWYLSNKDEESYEFYFSSDFIITFYYILTQKRKYNSKNTLLAIDALCDEILPWYLKHNDFILAKIKFFDNLIEDLEDLMILSSALRLGCEIFITNDKELLDLNNFEELSIVSTDSFKKVALI